MAQKFSETKISEMQSDGVADDMQSDYVLIEVMDMDQGSTYETSFSYDPDLASSLTNSERNPLLSSHEVRRRRKGSELPSKDYDSLDYDVCYNVPYKEMVRGYSSWTYWHMQFMKWVLVGIIGILTGLVAFFIDWAVRTLFKWKYSVFNTAFQATVGEGNVMLSFLVLLGFNVLFAIISSLLIVVEPVAAGSGIPEIKCYLNGVKVPHVTRVTTLISKAVGVLFSVAGGFFVGKEGPMIHSGAIIGAGVPQLRSMLFKKLKLPYPYFRSDRDKRDFVSSGAAAGVAAAFGAPIGGVLFSLEEGSSFWNQGLTWRTLFCSFCSTFSLNLFLSAILGLKFGNLGAPGLVDFGVFAAEEKRLWNAYHLLIFIPMGAVGGLMGALFNSINTRITIYRLKYLHRRHRLWRVAEAVLIAMVTTAAVFVATMLLGTCVPQDVSSATRFICGSYAEDTSFRNETKNYFCPLYGNTRSTMYYNDMATLLFNSQEEAIKQLFHQSGAFTLPTLAVAFFIIFFIACWTYGAGIPSGLFIPTLLIGAIYGRFVATSLKYVSNRTSLAFLSNLYPGTYALIGAASFLGGVVRMTISLTVILIESTNEIDFGLPIMISLMVAKWVGDLFNEGLYDIHIELKSTPLLGWESPDRMEKLSAEDVMNKDIRYMYPITRVRSVEQLLRTTVHSAFLIVTPVDTGTVLERPKNVSSRHTPQLYSRKSFRQARRLPSTGTDTTDVDDSDSDPDVEIQVELTGVNPFSVNQSSPLTRKREGATYPTLLETKDALTVSYSVPDHSRGMGIQQAYTNEQPPKKILIFHGIILRSQLVMLLKNRIFFDEDEGPDSQPRISHSEMTADYPRYPDVFELDLSSGERDMLMDLSLYMNPSPFTISNQAILPQVFNLFRTMGLRHLPVLRDNGIIVGIITRHDLTHERLHELRHEKRLKAREERKQRKKKRVRIIEGDVPSMPSPVGDSFMT